MLNLTKEEKLVLVFLVASFIVGSGVNYYKKRFDMNSSLRANEVSDRRESLWDEVISEIASSPSGRLRFATHSPSAPRNDAKININSAGFNELIKLKGIGVKTAERIIDYRQRNGPFFCKEDLMKVKGIGKAKFNTVKDGIIAE